MNADAANAANAADQCRNQPPDKDYARDPWIALRRYTNARIGQGRAGMSQTTGTHLEFQLAHARARDSVTLPLDMAGLARRISSAGFQYVRLHSRAKDRPAYLQRPDFGRMLDSDSVARLEKAVGLAGEPAPDLAIVVADGLSSLAIARHAVPFLSLAVPRLTHLGFSLAPLCLVEQGRVAVGDHVGQLLSASLAVVIIGERPGLSSPDSMGIYITWGPKPGVTDAMRNCISNIHGNGLSYGDALEKLVFLTTEARKKGLTGVGLKEAASTEGGGLVRNRNFLLEG